MKVEFKTGYEDFADDGLAEASISWKRLVEIRETDEAIYFFMRYNSSLKIPKSAFTGAPNAGEFIAFAASRIELPAENARNLQ